MYAISLFLPIDVKQCQPWPSFVRTMVTNAKKWAESRGLHRTNPVHGADEFRVPTEWTFHNKELNRTITRAASSCEVEAGHHLVLVEKDHMHLFLQQLCVFVMCWQDGKGLLVGEGADLSQDHTILNLYMH